MPHGRIRNIEVAKEFDTVIKSLDLSGHFIESDSQKKQLHNLLQNYSDVFSTDSFNIVRTSTVKHCIPLIDKHPFRLPHRRIPPAQYHLVKEQLEKMEKTEVIRRSSSPYASPIVIVHKKDGSLRVCIDYR